MRLLAPVLIFSTGILLSWCALATTTNERVNSSSKKDLAVLEYLTLAALPGEDETAPPAVDSAGFATLLGKPISKVSLAKPVMGFNPLEEIALPEDAHLTRLVVREATLSLWKTGNYRNIQLSGRLQSDDTVELVIFAEPMLRLRRLSVNGNEALDHSQIERIVDYLPDRTILPRSDLLTEMSQKIKAAYFKIGYENTKAAIKLEATGEPGGVALVIDVKEGSPERYTVIEFKGLPSDLPTVFVSRKIGLGRKTTRHHEKVEKAIDQLYQLLAEYGYRDAVRKPFKEEKLGKHQWKLTIQVEASIKTEIYFRGHKNFISRELEKRLVEDTVNFRTDKESVDRGIATLRAYYRRSGFFHARISARRYCILEDKPASLLTIAQSCPDRTHTQELHFAIKEGPPVEIALVDFIGNRYFDDKELKNELFAYMREQSDVSGTFRSINTDTLNDLGISDKRPEELGRQRGLKTPSFKPENTYVPRLYKDAMEHLTDVYREKGFLSVNVDDRCDLSLVPRTLFHYQKYSPLLISRKDTRDRKRQNLKPCVLISEDREQLIVRIYVNEGPQTKFSEVIFEGNTQISSHDLQKVVGIHPQDPYSELRIKESPRALALKYQSLGYMFASANWERAFSPDKRAAKVVFTINEGPKVQVGRIIIEGAEQTSKRLIRERLAFTTKDTLTPKVLTKSQQKLMELGIFTGVTIQMVSPEQVQATKNVKIQVAEVDPQYLELRGGIATVEGLRGGFEYGYRNLAGWALTGRLRARANYRLFFIGNPSFEERFHEMSALDQLERHIVASLGQPHLPLTRGLVGWQLDGVTERVNEPAFSADRNSGFITLNSNLSTSIKYRRAIVIEGRTGIEDTDLQLPPGTAEIATKPQFSSWLRMPEGPATFSVTGLNLTLDFRDHPFMPSKGFFASFGGDFVYSIGDTSARELTDEDGEPLRDDEGHIVRVNRVSNFIKAKATLSGYMPIGQTKMVLSLSSSIGYIFHLQEDSNTWADRYFYMGGVDTLRGFPEESLVPEDIYDELGSDPAFIEAAAQDDVAALSEYRGGQAMLLFRAELRYPITEGFYGAGFFEAGNLWRYLDNPFQPFILRPVAGGGLRYLTPVGPISLDMGVNLNQRTYEDRIAWSFSIGSAF